MALATPAPIHRSILGGYAPPWKLSRIEPAGRPEPEELALESLDADDPEGALDVLMEAYGPALYRYCRSLVKDPELAEEAHQLTFVQAYEALGTFGRRSSLRSWLFSIARHRCLDCAKIERRRRKRFQLTAVLPEAPHPEPTAEEELGQRDRLAALKECLQRLPERIRETVLLRYAQGLSYVEMEDLGTGRAATLQARVARALPRLRTCLEEKGYDEGSAA